MTQKILDNFTCGPSETDILHLIFDSSTKRSGRVSQENIEFWLLSASHPWYFLRQSSEESFPDLVVSLYEDVSVGILLPSFGVFSGQIRRESSVKYAVFGGSDDLDLRPGQLCYLIGSL